MLRIFRLIKTSIQLRMLLSTIVSSLGTIFEIIALMTALLLIFAFIGMEAFDGPEHYAHMR